jgi:hypothetical protein
MSRLAAVHLRGLTRVQCSYRARWRGAGVGEGWKRQPERAADRPRRAADEIGWDSGRHVGRYPMPVLELASIYRGGCHPGRRALFSILPERESPCLPGARS